MEELALLRAIAANPYDHAYRAAYADWLREQGRENNEAEVRATLPGAALRPANWMTNGELIGQLLRYPLDAVVLYRACSDYCTLQPDHVTLSRAEDREIIFREESGYSDYNPNWFETDAEAAARCEKERAAYRERYGSSGSFIRPNNIYKAEKPDFRTVVHFPGN